MIPVKLSIEGIYSYRERADIDFNRLCEARLFGIFGPVGSGKSAILEAITYALYGETERMNNKEGRAYNMMNLKSNRMWIDFEFMAGSDGTDRYRFTVELRRNSKDFSNVGTPKRLAFKWEQNEWHPLSDTKAEPIIGISYDNFIKTVIIPQGRFQDFLGMSTTDRTRMLKELFDLQRFDLAGQTGMLIKANNAELDTVKGRMLENPEVAEEEITQRKHQYSEIEQHLKGNAQLLQDTEAAIRMQAQTKDLSSEIETLRNWLKSKESELTGIEAREKKLKQYADADALLRDLLEQENKLSAEFELAKQSNQKLKGSLENAKPALATAQIEFDAAKTAYLQRDELTLKAISMETMGKIQGLVSEMVELKGRIENGKTKIADQNLNIDNCKQQIEDQQTANKEIEANLPNLHALMELQQWFTQKSALQKQLQDLKKGSEDAQMGVSELEQQMQSLAEHGSEALMVQKSGIEQQLSHARDQLDRFRTHQRLIEFASQLEDGAPCPLCGALEHPEPMNASGNDHAIQEANRQFQVQEQALKEIQEKIRLFQSLHERLDDRKKQLDRAKSGWNEVERQVNALESNHPWPEKQKWSEQDTLNAYSAAKEQSEILKKGQSSLESLRNNLQTLEHNKQKYNSGLQALELELGNLNGKQETLLSQVNLAEYESLRTQSLAFFEAEAAQLRKQLETVEKTYREKESNLNLWAERVRTLETEAKLAEQRSQSLEEQLKGLSGKLESKMAEQGFGGRDEVANLLQQRLDVARERREIDQFRVDMIEKKATLDGKLAALGSMRYDGELHAQLIAKQGEITRQIAQQQQALGGLQKELKHLSDRQEQYLKLRKDFDRLENRQKDLKTMEGLFRGDGFVNWVSKVYLRELCQRANARFQALTRNRLSLELSEDNSFLVRDMVNDGQLRSVKTLSGGQTFQAALSLALALADNIHMRNQNMHNFFFLDEGFGSLDRDSLQIVFETLKALRRENRVVGVISHVEELQQEIDVALRIQVDEERGSLIRID